MTVFLTECDGKTVALIIHAKNKKYQPEPKNTYTFELYGTFKTTNKDKLYLSTSRKISADFNPMLKCEQWRPVSKKWILTDSVRSKRIQTVNNSWFNVEILEALRNRSDIDWYLKILVKDRFDVEMEYYEYNVKKYDNIDAEVISDALDKNHLRDQHDCLVQAKITFDSLLSIYDYSHDVIQICEEVISDMNKIEKSGLTKSYHTADEILSRLRLIPHLHELNEYWLSKLFKLFSVINIFSMIVNQHSSTTKLVDVDTKMFKTVIEAIKDVGFIILHAVKKNLMSQVDLIRVYNNGLDVKIDNVLDLVDMISEYVIELESDLIDGNGTSQELIGKRDDIKSLVAVISSLNQGNTELGQMFQALFNDISKLDSDMTLLISSSTNNIMQGLGVLGDLSYAIERRLKEFIGTAESNIINTINNKVLGVDNKPVLDQIITTQDTVTTKMDNQHTSMFNLVTGVRSAVNNGTNEVKNNNNYHATNIVNSNKTNLDELEDRVNMKLVGVRDDINNGIDSKYSEVINNMAAKHSEVTNTLNNLMLDDASIIDKLNGITLCTDQIKDIVSTNTDVNDIKNDVVGLLSMLSNLTQSVEGKLSEIINVISSFRNEIMGLSASNFNKADDKLNKIITLISNAQVIINVNNKPVVLGSPIHGIRKIDAENGPPSYEFVSNRLKLFNINKNDVVGTAGSLPFSPQVNSMVSSYQSVADVIVNMCYGPLLTYGDYLVTDGNTILSNHVTYCELDLFEDLRVRLWYGAANKPDFNSNVSNAVFYGSFSRPPLFLSN